MRFREQGPSHPEENKPNAEIVQIAEIIDGEVTKAIHGNGEVNEAMEAGIQAAIETAVQKEIAGLPLDEKLLLFINRVPQEAHDGVLQEILAQWHGAGERVRHAALLQQEAQLKGRVDLTNILPESMVELHLYDSLVLDTLQKGGRPFQYKDLRRETFLRLEKEEGEWFRVRQATSPEKQGLVAINGGHFVTGGRIALCADPYVQYADHTEPSTKIHLNDRLFFKFSSDNWENFEGESIRHPGGYKVPLVVGGVTVDGTAMFEGTIGYPDE